MLLIIHTKAYQDFLNLLLQLKNQCQHGGEICSEASSIASGQHLDSISNKSEDRAIWTNLKQVFQERIISLTDEDLNPEVAHRWLSLQTEVQREFRLLSTDWLFLASSRQPATKEARTKAVLERLSKLISYCQAMLTIEGTRDEEGGMRKEE